MVKPSRCAGNALGDHAVHVRARSHCVRQGQDSAEGCAALVIEPPGALEVREARSGAGDVFAASACADACGQRGLVRLKEGPMGALAWNIASLRRERGLTIERAAWDAGVAPRHWNKLESGDCNPTVSTLVKVAVALGADLAALFAPIRH